jgi:hypothetical protein
MLRIRYTFLSLHIHLFLPFQYLASHVAFYPFASRSISRAGHRHPYKAYVQARNTAPVHRTGRGIAVARPYPMYGLWMTVITVC